MATRRQFIQYIPVAAAAVLAACSKKEPEAPAAAPEAPAAAAPEAPAAAAPAAEAAPAAAAEAVLETDANAVQLGYVLDAAKADKAKFPQFKDGNICGNCALYAGAADSAQGPCGLFGGKLVAHGGWCSAYAPKPA